MPTHKWTTKQDSRWDYDDDTRPLRRVPVEDESGRGGGSFAIGAFGAFVIFIFITFFMASVPFKSERPTETVPNSWVPPGICMVNGPVTYITRFPDNPGVMYVHCAFGNITATIATPAGH